LVVPSGRRDKDSQEKSQLIRTWRHPGAGRIANEQYKNDCSPEGSCLPILKSDPSETIEDKIQRCVRIEVD